MKIPRWVRNFSLGLGAFVLVVMASFLLLIAVLPSPQKLYSQIPKKSNSPLVLPSEKKAILESEAPVPDSQDVSIAVSGDGSEAPVEIETLTDEQVQRRLIDDLISRERPVSNFCNSLSRPNSNKIPISEFLQLAKVSVITENEDPRVQSMKPFLRTLVRMPQMKQLIELAENSAGSNETGFMKSAEFYTQVAKVYTELKSNNAEISSVLDRSYLFHGLNQLLTSRPDLVNNEKVKNFCFLVEDDFNQLRPVDYESEKRQFINLLEQFGLSAKDIGFSIEYRSDLSFGLNGLALKMNGGWIKDLFNQEPPPKTKTN